MLLERMIIDLITLKESPLHFAFSLAPDEIDLDDETVKLEDSVKVEGTLIKGIVQTDVEGEIAACAEFECSRCLQTAEEQLKIPFSVSYITPESYTTEEEAELNPDDLQVSIFDGEKIDVTELVREQILLDLPEQIFCREDCRGLCPQCGANRNLIDCNCVEKEIDPRWQGLRELKIKN